MIDLSKVRQVEREIIDLLSQLDNQQLNYVYGYIARLLEEREKRKML